MKDYKNIHWEVIGGLAPKRQQDQQMKVLGFPFMHLRDSHKHRIHYENMIRTPIEEERFLNHLVKYLNLERLYHPDSTSALTLEEFKFHTSYLRSQFSMIATNLGPNSLTNMILDGVESVSENLKDLDHPETLPEADRLEFEKLDPNEREELIKCMKELKMDVVRQRSEQRINDIEKCASLAALFSHYHTLFQTLVEQENFKE